MSEVPLYMAAVLVVTKVSLKLNLTSDAYLAHKKAPPL
jgi:hypothetical protein